MHPRLPDQIRDYARSLRLHQTDAENLLWMLLRGGRLGFKFRRQHPVGRYILDFYCHQAQLAVELDGGEHNEDVAATKDETRSRALQEIGIEILRFWNHDVLGNTEAVLEQIYRVLVERTGSLTPAPHPEGEGIADPTARRR